MFLLPSLENCKQLIHLFKQVIVKKARIASCDYVILECQYSTIQNCRKRDSISYFAYNLAKQAMLLASISSEI